MFNDNSDGDLIKMVHERNEGIKYFPYLQKVYKK